MSENYPTIPTPADRKAADDAEELPITERLKMLIEELNANNSIGMLVGGDILVDAYNALIAVPPLPASEVSDEAVTAAKDEGADFVLVHLAKALGLERWEQKDGTESWDGDVLATLYAILRDSGAIDPETNKPHLLPSIGEGSEAEPADLKRAEAAIMRDYEIGNLTKLGVANHLRRAGFNIHYATERANALHPPQGGEVKVRELDWERPVGSNTMSRADTLLGIYRVWTYAEAGGKWFWSLRNEMGHGSAGGDIASEEEGQAAAQADFCARVKSALVQP